MTLFFKRAIFFRALTFVVGLSVAIIVSHFFSRAQEFLIPLTALFVMQDPIGNIGLKSVLRFLFIVLLVSVMSFLTFSLFLLSARLFDVTIGALIGMLANLIIFPRRVDVEFRDKMMKTIEVYRDYFIQMLASGSDKEIEIENTLLSEPTWVYERIFDPTFQKGHRFFLMNVEQLGELLIAMRYHANLAFAQPLDEKIRIDFQRYSLEAIRFFNAIIDRLQLKEIKEPISDLSEEIALLKEASNTLSWAENPYFIEFIQDLMDLQQKLRVLLLALRS